MDTRRLRTALTTNSLLLRLRCAWNILRDRPTLYRLHLHGGQLFLEGTLVARFVIRDTEIISSERPDDMRFISVGESMNGTTFREP